MSDKALATALDGVGFNRIYDRLAEDTPPAAMFAVASAAILRAARIVAARADDALTELGLTVPRFEVLGLLNVSECGRMGFSQLKQTMFIHPATMGHTIRQLEAAGLIRRETDATDRRAFSAVITSKGRRLADAATRALSATHFGVDGLSESAARDLVLILASLAAK